MNVNDPVTVIRGIGPRISAQLKVVGIEFVRDLLLCAPLRYEDRSRTTPLSELDQPDQWVLVRCEIVKSSSVRTRKRNLWLTQADLKDKTGTFRAVWFNRGWMSSQLEKQSEVYLYGPVRRSRSGLRLVNPEIEAASPNHEAEGIVPVYGKLGPLSGRRLRRIVSACLSSVSSIDEPLPPQLLKSTQLMPIRDALTTIHKPPDMYASVKSAIHRLAFDEALAFYCGMIDHVRERRSHPGPSCRVNEQLRNAARQMLPFKLTGGQWSAVGEIAADLQSGLPMARLVQGDVGSGKTVVAALAMLIVVENGFQAAMMAPTELLAEQHFQSLKSLYSGTSFEVSLLTSSLTVGERKQIRQRLARGEINIIVGTHALIQSSVEFGNLGLVVIDEQHRFGVAQRQNLVDKGASPHVLVMTATPIPRSLALTVFGDLDVSIIADMPPGRKSVKTLLRSSPNRQRIYQFITEEVTSGGRAFIVYPLIEESEAIAARALEQYIDEVSAALPEIRLGVLHGRLSNDERNGVYEDFRSGRVEVLLATTVVEVGVDVPEASIMVIESADRFGLAQLHQLRGRVGRGERESWCILLVDGGISPETQQRLEILVDTQSGFDIAEHDLAMRGAGELKGTRQWGSNGFRFVNLARDHDLLKLARKTVIELEARGRLEEVKTALASFHPLEFTLSTG